ncbi:hypothetical protein LLG07_06080 [bacterium]|nr:hypothetical protein [bacterium]
MFIQLTLDIKEELTSDFKNYDWLKGYPENLIPFFKEKLEDKNLDPKLRKDALKRLKELTKGKY